MEPDEDRELAASLATLTVAGITVVILLMMMMKAPASEVCLTKAQARQLWPRQHIYWYSSDHCWSNRRGPPRGIKVDPIINSHAEAKPAGPPVKVVKPEDYNELDAQADRDTFFRTEPPFPYWAHVMEYDLSRFKTWYERIETWR